MAGRDVRNTEINNYLGPNSGPGRGISRKRLALLVVGVLVLSAAGIQGVLWENERHTADILQPRRGTPASVRSANSATAGGATASAGSATPSAARTEPPFVVRSSFPGSALDPIAAGSPWAIVLDRTLTPSEIAGLEQLDGVDGQTVWDYLRRFHARIASDNWLGTGPRTTFKMLFLSDDSTSLSIQSMQPEKIHCTESTAVTVINFATEGDEAVPTVAFSLRKPAVPLAGVNNDGESTGPYFGSHQIDLGPGTTPGALDVQASGESGKSCSWRFRVGFATASGQSTQEVENAGKPFVLEGVPLHPVQSFQYGLDESGRPRWSNCVTTDDCS